MKYWIMKSEPDTFSIDDLKREKTQFWDGVRNYQVRNMFRDQMKKGDIALFYHSSAKIIGVAGEMKVIQDPEADPTQFDPKNSYYDKGSKKDDPRWLGPIVKFVNKFKEVITLDEIKKNPKFKNLRLIQKGSRLSVSEISEAEYLEFKKLSK